MQPSDNNHTHIDLTWRIDALDRQILLLKSNIENISHDVDVITAAQQKTNETLAQLNTAVQVIQARLWFYPALAGFVGALVGALLGAGVAAFLGALLLNAQVR